MKRVESPIHRKQITKHHERSFLIGPMAMDLWYPRLSISGTNKVPRVPEVAMVEPESVAKMVPETRVSTLNRPGIRPIQLSRISITCLAIPE